MRCVMRRGVILPNNPHTYVKGCAENRRLFDRKFKIVRIGRFWLIQRVQTQKICEIS